MNNSNVGQFDISNDISHDGQLDENHKQLVMRATSENVNQAGIKFSHPDDLTAGSYEKDRTSCDIGEPEIDFEDMRDD